MRSTLRLVLVCVLSLLVVACPDDSSSGRADVTWSRSFGANGFVWDEAAAAIPTSDGGYLFAGTRGALYDTRDARDEEQVDGEAWVVKLTGAGNPDWEVTYGEPFLSPAGNRVVYTHAVDAGGGETWLAGKESAAELPTGDPLADGGNLVIARIGATGDVLFRRIHDSGAFTSFPFTSLLDTAHEQVRALAATPDGGLLAVCWISARVDKEAEMRSGVEVNAVWVVKLDSNGDVTWDTHLLRRSDGVLHDRFFPYHPGAEIELGVCSGDDNGALVTAYSSAEPYTELVRMQSNGTVLWSRVRDDGHVRGCAPVDTDADGARDDAFVLAGIDRPHADRQGFLVLVSGDSGNPIWGRTDEEVNGFECVSQGNYINPDGVQAPAVAAAGVREAGEGRILFVSLDNSGAEAIDPYIVDHAAGITHDLDRWRVLAFDAGGAFVNSFSDSRISLGAEILARTPGLDTAQLLTDGSVIDVARELTPARVVLTRLAPSGDVALEREFPVSGTFVERVHDVVELAGGAGYAVLAETSSYADDLALPWLLLLDEHGDVLRQIALESLLFPLSPGERLNVLAATRDGGVALAVLAGGYPRVVRFDAAGEELWNSEPLSPGLRTIFLGSALESCRGLVETADGGFVTVGARQDSGFWAARLDANGAVIWRRGLEPSNGRLLDVTDVLALADGFAFGGVHDGEPFVARVDDAGNVAAAGWFPFGGAAAGPVTRLAAAEDGGLLVGTSWIDLEEPAGDIGDGAASTGRINVLLLHLTDTLDPTWYRVYGGLYDEHLSGLEAVPEGGWLVSGRSDSLGDRGEAWLLRVDHEGLITEECNAYLQGGEWPLPRIDVNILSTAFVPDVHPDELGPMLLTLVDTPALAQFPPEAVVARQCVGYGPVGGPDEEPPAEGTYTLTLEFEGGGSGRVFSFPAGLDCRATCSATFPAGTEVSLTPVRDDGSFFSNWTGCDQDFGEEGCVVLLDSDRTVSVSFE